MEADHSVKPKTQFVFLESKKNVSVANGNERETEATNMSYIGSERDHKIREAAAKTEPQWMSISPTNGVMVWQVDGPNLKQLPKFKHGKFCMEDCYLVLHSHKTRSKFPSTSINGKPHPIDSNDLKYDLHVWVGSKSSGVIQGIAAYKLVEANAYLGRKATQHHEEQDNESKLFLSYFGNRIEVYEQQLLNHVKNVLNRSKTKKKDSSTKGLQRLMKMLATQDLDAIDVNPSNFDVNNIAESHSAFRNIKLKQFPIHDGEKSDKVASNIFKKSVDTGTNTRLTSWKNEKVKRSAPYSPTIAKFGGGIKSLDYSPSHSPCLKSVKPLRQSHNHYGSNSITTFSSDKLIGKISTAKSIIVNNKNKDSSHFKPTTEEPDAGKMMRHNTTLVNSTVSCGNESYSSRSYKSDHRQVSKENSRANANIDNRHKTNESNDYLEPLLFQIRPSVGAKLKLVARITYARAEKSNRLVAKKINRSILDSKQGYLLDTGSHIYIWIGRFSSEYQKKLSPSQVKHYLLTHHDTQPSRHQTQSPITVIHEGESNSYFDSFFVDHNNQSNDITELPCCVKNPGNNVLRYIKACQTPTKKSSSSSSSANTDTTQGNFARTDERNTLQHR